MAEVILLEAAQRELEEIAQIQRIIAKGEG